jgi:hypothetical protein
MRATHVTAKKPTLFPLWLAALVVVPVTAILHHAVFFFSQCMLNPVGGDDYSVATVTRWLTIDPSLPIACVVAAAVYALGRRFAWVRSVVIAFVIGFAPLSLWVWDIPFTERVICRSWHDNRIVVHARHLYMFGALVTPALLVWMRRRAR